MMLDQHEMRLWADHRRALRTWLDAIGRQILEVSEVAVRKLYAAPWETVRVCRAGLGRSDGRDCLRRDAG